MQRAEGAQKRLLGDIGRLLRVFQVQVGQAEHALLMLPHEFLPGGRVAAPGALNPLGMFQDSLSGEVRYSLYTPRQEGSTQAFSSPDGSAVAAVATTSRVEPS
jgi:hypothetical protein